MIELLALGMNTQDGNAVFQCRKGYHHLTVEAARPEQGGIERLGAVGRCEHDDPRRRFEPVHLGQELVQRLLTLVVRNHGARTGAALADRVDLVDEDDGGGAVSGLFEKVPHASCTHPDVHFDEAGTGDGEERDARLACHSTREECLPRSRRSDHQHASWRHRARPRVPVRTLKEVHHFLDLFFGSLVARYVCERRARPLFVEDLGFRSAHPEHSLNPAAACALGEAPPQPSEQDERQQQDDPGQHLRAEGGAARGGRDLSPRGLQIGQERRTGLRRDGGRVVISVTKGSLCAAIATNRDGLDLVGRDVVEELSEVEGYGRLGLGRGQEEEQQDEQCCRDEPEPVTPSRRGRGCGRDTSVVGRGRGRVLSHTAQRSTTAVMTLGPNVSSSVRELRRFVGTFGVGWLPARDLWPLRGSL